jgi:hypothetical protein
MKFISLARLYLSKIVSNISAACRLLNGQSGSSRRLTAALRVVVVVVAGRQPEVARQLSLAPLAAKRGTSPATRLVSSAECWSGRFGHLCGRRDQCDCKCF